MSATVKEQPGNLARAYELLGLLRQEVRRLEQLNDGSAEEIMGEVSTFETDWWGSHG